MQQTWMRGMAVALGAVLAALPPLAPAAVNQWNYTGGMSNWMNAANWSLGHVPTALEDVVIDGAKVELTNDTAILNSLLVTNGATLYLLSPSTNGVAPWGLTLSVTGALRVVDGSWVYPTSEPTNGGSAVVSCDNLVVDATSGFNANARGFRGANAYENGVYNPPGYGPGRTVGGTYCTGGASYGGKGGLGPVGGSAAGNTYGSYTNPTQPGSGAGGSQTSMAGKDGGGLIRVLAADSVVLDGSLLANGESGGSYAGVGSGGGVYVQCRTFEGTGRIEAKGGDHLSSHPSRGGGGGGGGRIAVVYDTTAQGALGTQPTVTFNAAGGNRSGGTVAHAKRGQARPGSLYFSDNVFFDLARIGGGDILVPGVSSWSGTSLSLSGGLIAFPTGFSFSVTEDVTLTSKGGLDFSNCTVNIGRDLILGAGIHPSTWFRGGPAQQVTLGRDLSLSGGWVDLSYQGMASTVFAVPGSASFSAGSMYAYAQPSNACALTVTGSLLATNGAALYLYSGMVADPADYGLLVDVSGNMTVATNSWIYPFSHYTNGGSVHFRAANLSVNNGGGINASYRGFSGGIYGVQNSRGYGPGAPPGNGGGGQASGAGYGGRGGGCSASNVGGPAYGSSNAPVEPGSGGNAGGWGAYAPGGYGGGLVLVEADTVIMDGSLLADGQSQPHRYAGAGSGGGVYVQCKTFAGGVSGLMSVNGGDAPNGQTTGGGGGGGGRIAVKYTRSVASWSGTARAFGGDGKYEDGENGTIVFWKPPPQGTVLLVR